MKDPTDNASTIEIMPKMKICEKKNSLIVYVKLFNVVSFLEFIHIPIPPYPHYKKH